jgi:hypothetical protein
MFGAVDVDASATSDDGFRVEHREESEHRSQTEDVRELDDHTTEVRRKQETEFRLDEVKVKDSSPRPVTFEEMRALIEAEFSASGDGDIELEIGREITTEEFTTTQREHTTTEPTTGESKTEVTTTESHSREETTVKPPWNRVPVVEAQTEGAAVDETIPAAVAVDVSLSSAPPLSVDVSMEADVSGSVDAAIVGPSVSLKGPEVSVTQPPALVTTDLYTYLTSPLQSGGDESAGVGLSASADVSGKPKGGGKLFGKLKLNKKKPKPAALKAGAEVEVKVSDDSSKDGDDAGSLSSLQKKPQADVEMTVEAGGDALPEAVAATAAGGRSRKHHEVKHKKHIIEEVVLEDTDTFYEEYDLKRPRLVIGGRKKKAGKENAIPEPERRRSTGELPSPIVTEPSGPRAISVTNVSSDQQVTFVVNYDLPARAVRKSPKDRWSWTLPTFKASGKGSESPSVSESSTAKEKKPKTGSVRQEEVVVEDTGLFTDSSSDKKKWGFRFKKPQLRAGHTEGVEPTTETVTFIVQPDPGSSYVKVEPRQEEQDSPSPMDNDETKDRPHSGIELPKFKLFDRKHGKSANEEEGEIETVTYVVEQPSDVDASAQVAGGGHGGIELPKVKLPDIHLPDIHFGVKGSSKKGDGNVESTETVTYVVEHQPSIPEGDAEGSTDVDGKVEARGGFECRSSSCSTGSTENRQYKAKLSLNQWTCSRRK